MNEQLHHLLDGDISDGEMVDLLRSLVGDEAQRTLFREQMKLQGALFRNEGHGGMSPAEESEMMARVGSAIGVTTAAALPRRLGSRVWALVVSALLVGGTAGFVGNDLLGNDSGGISQTAVVPAAQHVASPCNCDSAVAASTASVRDSIQRVAKANATQARKPAARAKRYGNRGGAVTGMSPSSRSGR